MIVVITKTLAGEAAKEYRSYACIYDTDKKHRNNDQYNIVSLFLQAYHFSFSWQWLGGDYKPKIDVITILESGS